MFAITAVGNLAANPTQKEINNTKVTSFTLLSTIQDVTTQFDCSVWGNRGDVVSLYITKGDQITITGNASLNLFSRRDGTPGGSIKVRVNDFSLPSKKRNLEAIPA